MCLILFAYQQHVNFPLVLAANRDERFDRATRAAQFWPESPDLLAGRDLQAGGTWLGITQTGRFAAVTNFRGHPIIQGKLSRGELCSDFLSSDISSDNFAQTTVAHAEQYAGFNLLVFDGKNFVYCNNHNNSIQYLQPGIYGLSNGLLDAPWPKIDRGKRGLNAIIANNSIQTEHILSLLHDDEVASDHILPETGVGVERERLLSPLFIRAIDSHSYGTCNSTALLINKNDEVTFHERSYYQQPVQTVPNDQRFTFQLQKAH